MLCFINNLVFASTKIVQQMKQRDNLIKSSIQNAGDGKYTKKHRQRVRDILKNSFHLEEMAKRSLEKHWKNLTDEQKQQFTDLFSQLILYSSTKSLDRYEAKVSYRNANIKKNGTGHIEARIIHNGDRIRMSYELQKSKNKQEWIITDFMIDNVSTVESYQISFDEIIAESGINDLLEKLQKKVKELKK